MDSAIRPAPINKIVLFFKKLLPLFIGYCYFIKLKSTKKPALKHRLLAILLCFFKCILLSAFHINGTAWECKTYTLFFKNRHNLIINILLHT